MSTETVPTETTATKPGETAPRKRGVWARLFQLRWLYLLLIPGVAYFAIFRYAPMYGAVIAFKDYVPFLGINDSAWIGFEHFEEFFTNPDFARLLRNTLILALLNLLIAFPVPIILAMLLNEVRISIVKRTVQTLIYIPHFLSWTIVASLTYLLFAIDVGPLFHLINNALGTQVDFLTDPAWFRPIIVLQELWKNSGWGTIIYLAALATVNQDHYEAAIIDGAGRLRRAWHITLPAISSTIVVLLILQIGQILNTGFEQIYLMSNSLNRSVADVFDTYVYFVGITQGAYSYSTAVGLFKAVVGIVLIVGANLVAKRINQTGIF
ncbi:ABC transporter permease [Actinopolymorpha pittospori]|uniref:Aldouronate transport system permease protein n=1 Tax=Actinopolymorpha pittospori TaxID=648752 RepID=A0A927RKT9_9ACTN|nr:ABC transporter permease subunit [Actinopolymorpha pittospori]MBE1608566.1 putative aldouronate transport system permease protein [Actinopolymorpha pittospori]